WSEGISITIDSIDSLTLTAKFIINDRITVELLNLMIEGTYAQISFANKELSFNGCVSADALKFYTSRGSLELLSFSLSYISIKGYKDTSDDRVYFWLTPVSSAYLSIGSLTVDGWQIFSAVEGTLNGDVSGYFDNTTNESTGTGKELYLNSSKGASAELSLDILLCSIDIDASFKGDLRFAGDLENPYTHSVYLYAEDLNYGSITLVGSDGKGVRLEGSGYGEIRGSWVPGNLSTMKWQVSGHVDALHLYLKYGKEWISIWPPLGGKLKAFANGPYYGKPGEEILFNGAAIGGKPPYSWQWEFGDGTTSDEEESLHAYNEIGIYCANLTVTDSRGKQDIDQAWVYISDLEAEAGGPYEGWVGNDITLQGSATGGTGGYTYHWDIKGKGVKEGQEVTYYFDHGEGGRHIATLIVNDSSGFQDIDTTLVIVREVTLQVDPNPAKPNEEVVFTATVKENGDNKFYYKFDFGDGDTTELLYDEDGDGKVTAKHSYSERGTYEAKVSIYDDSNQKLSESLPVEVDVHTIRVDIGGPYYGWANETVEFHADIRGIPSGGWVLIRAEWEFGDGCTANGIDVTHVYTEGDPDGKVYHVNFTLEVFTYNHVTVEKSTNATIYSGEKHYPTAVINPSDIEVLPGSVIQFDASGSLPGEGRTIEKYEWKVWPDDMATERWHEGGPTFTYAFSPRGSDYPYLYVVWVRVTNDQGLQDCASASVLVTKIKAVIDAPEVATDIEDIVFSGARSSPNPYKEVKSWYWDFGDGNSTGGDCPYYAVVTHRYADDGYYFVKLRVRDTGGNEDTKIKRIYVRNVPPTAEFRADPLVTVIGDTVAFNDSSFDLDGYILGRIWRFGDGSVARGENVTHVYSKSGFYTVQLEVMDDDGDKCTLTKEDYLLIADAIVDDDYDENT
ncbi:MAG: hypothetical protein DRN33_05970, partial [Thermoplasmata archaeon]